MVADQLQEVLTSGIAIDQAKGIIAARLECSTDKAFTQFVATPGTAEGALGASLRMSSTTLRGSA